MKKKVLAVLVLLFSMSCLGSESGPEFSKLKPSYIYTRDNDMGVYVQFNEGSMPGCRNNKGGYLLRDNDFFELINSQLLVLSTMGGMRGKVNFVNNGTEGRWSECKILGLQLKP